MSDALFGVFVVVWLLTRHVLYPLVCWSVYRDLPRLIGSACYRGSMDKLEGPLPGPPSKSYLSEPFRNPVGTVCFDGNITLGFLACLLILQAMMFIWSVSVIRVVLRVLRGGSADDIRSDGEEEDAEEKIEQEAYAIEEEVGVEELNLQEWKHRTGAKKAGNSSGVTLSRNNDRKELLKRIGCEKQVD